MEAQEIKTSLVQSIGPERTLAISPIDWTKNKKAYARTGNFLTEVFSWYYVSVMVSIVTHLKNYIHEAFDNLGISVMEVHLEHPEIKEHGDYSTNAALHYAKDARSE